MAGLRDSLVAVFAGLSCAEIEAAPQPLLQAFPEVASYDDLVALPGFAEEFARVRTSKRHIERIEALFPKSVADQALQCLNLLKDRRARSRHPGEDYRVTRDLIKGSLYQTWSAVDRAAFDSRLQVFDDWCDFFVSYTNRDATATNKRYKALIGHQLGWPGPAKAIERNYVARVIAKFLDQQNLRGFVDYNSLQCGDEIGATLDSRCATAHAFVQLVEDALLVEPAPPGLNWCHREYLAFKQAAAAGHGAAVQANRCFFVLASSPPLCAPAGLAEPYQPWFAEMDARLHIAIDDHNTAPYDGLKLKVKEIAAQIVKARAELIEAMLASWPQSPPVNLP